ncbi:MAG: cytochrome c family protein [Pseudomonadota bacterium]
MQKLLLRSTVAIALLAAPATVFAQDAVDHTAAVTALGGDAKKGKRVFNKCKACHVADDEKNKVGPHLVGIFGRAAGGVESFDKKYSKAMKNSGIVWTVEELLPYLKNPKKHVKGTKMAFGGLRKEKDINNLLAYLLETSGETPAEGS